MTKENKLSKGRLRAIIVTGISCVVAVALIITNLFIPVKYLSSYLVIGNKGAADGVMRVRFVDVGYGDCTIIELPDGKNMLIDGGDGSKSNQLRILKFLNKCGIDTIDYLVCTSVNSEHCGGLAELIQYKSVKKIFMPYCTNKYITEEFFNFSFAASSCGAELVISEYGVGESNGEYGYFFTFLSPSVHSDPNGEYAYMNSNQSSQEAKNNASSVIWLEYAGVSFLFTGDIGDSVKTQLVDSYTLMQSIGENYWEVDGYSVRLEECNVVTVSAHGSDESACAEFYEFIQPEYAVISVGDNGQGCPSATAIGNAVNYVGDNLYRTDEYGTVTIEVTENGYGVV